MLRAIAIALCLQPSVTKADLVVMDFQSLEHVDSATVSHGNVYSENGFALSVDTAAGNAGFRTFGTLEFRYTGSTAMLMGNTNAITTLTKDAGGAFGVTSIDLAELNDSSPAVVSFVATLSGGGTTEQTFTLDGVAFGAETFSFNSSFDNILSLSWEQNNPAHQFDNIQITSIPEASSFLCIGLVALGFVGWKKRKRAS